MTNHILNVLSSRRKTSRKLRFIENRLELAEAAMNFAFEGDDRPRAEQTANRLLRLIAIRERLAYPHAPMPY